MVEENKRTHQRYDSQNLLAYVVYHPDGSVARQGMGRTLNVSESGILLETHISVEDGQRVGLTIGLEESLVDIFGVAIYSRAGREGRFETGIEFRDVDAEQKATLDRFIIDFQKQKNEKKDS